jgi:hypothetical protein
MGKPLLKLFQVLAGENIVVPALGATRHNEMILAYSLFIRPTPDNPMGHSGNRQSMKRHQSMDTRLER